MNQENYCQAITNIHGILKLWRTRNYSIEGNMEVFKTLVISKLVYLALPTVILNHITDEVGKIQKSFIWHDSSSKTKYEILRMKFKAGGLKSVDILFKLVLGLKIYMIIVFMTERYVIALPIKPSCVLSQFLMV